MSLDEKSWQIVLERIRSGRCTPFLGAGVNLGILPLGAEVAQKWAEDYNYPLEDVSDLVKVSQFMAIDQRDAMYPKEKILTLLQERLAAWKKGVNIQEFFRNQNEPLSVLTKLPFPVYLTTNYDDLLINGLRTEGKDPQREFCPWNKYARKKQTYSVFEPSRGFVPSENSPVVYHLHGNDECPESLVLTEDDYLDFLINISKYRQVLPNRIEEAFAGSSLLFIGYRLADWDFKILFRGLVKTLDGTLRRLSVSVQLPPEVPEERRPKVQEYLAQYIGNIGGKVQVYWGTARQFTAELRDRWIKFSNAT